MHKWCETMSNFPNRLVTSYVDSTDSVRCDNARREALSLLAHYALWMENYYGGLRAAEHVNGTGLK